MSARDVTAGSVLELRERMDESTMDDRWCAKSVCEEAIDAIEASRAEVAALRRQLEERRVVVPVPTQDEHDAIYPAPDLAENEMAYRAFWNAFEKGATWVASRIHPLSPGEAQPITQERIVEKRLDAIESMARALRSGDAEKGVG